MTTGRINQVTTVTPGRRDVASRTGGEPPRGEARDSDAVGTRADVAGVPSRGGTEGIERLTSRPPRRRSDCLHWDPQGAVRRRTGAGRSTAVRGLRHALPRRELPSTGHAPCGADVGVGVLPSAFS